MTNTERNELLDKALHLAAQNALKKAAAEPWSAEAPWIMAFKEWALQHSVEDPNGAMLWADLHVSTILHAVNNFDRIKRALSALVQSIRTDGGIADEDWPELEAAEAALMGA